MNEQRDLFGPLAGKWDPSLSEAKNFLLLLREMNLDLDLDVQVC